MILMGNVDTYMLSYVSNEAVAGVALANQAIFLSILLLRAVSTGTQVILTQYAGAGRTADASRIMSVSITLNLLIGGVLSLILASGSGIFMGWMSGDASVVAHGRMFLSLVGGFMFSQALIQALSTYLRAYGFVREAFYVSCGINLANMAGNYLFIFGPLHTPGLEVAGVAIATAASRSLGVLALFIYAVVRLPWLKGGSKWGFLDLRRSDLANMLRIGVPSSLETLTYHTVQTVFLYLVSSMGTPSLAARQYAYQLIAFVSLFSSSISSANLILVGRSIGSGDKQSAFLQTFRSVRWSLLLTVMAYAALIVLRKPLLGLYTSDPYILDIGSTLIVLGILIETGRNLNVIIVSSLRAAGDAPFTLWMGLVSMVGISLPVGYGLSVGWALGVVGIWLAIALDEWLRGIVMSARWNGRRWERLSI